MKTACAELLKNKFLALVSAIAVEMGVKVYFVGGGLRDMLMDREMKDLDFALEGRPEELPEIFARRIGGTFFWLNEQRLQSRVVKKSDGNVLTFDFAPLRGCDIVQDLSLRDFTMNAFAVSLTEEKSAIIDPLNGLHDLRQCLIRACSEDSFDHDPLRLLRAIRFAAISGFSIESGTWRKIREKAPLLQRVAPERIRTEFFQILDASRAAPALGKLHDSALLPEIIPFCFTPEESDSPTIDQRISNLIEVEGIMAQPDFHFPGVGEYIYGYLGRGVESGVTMSSLVKLAVFLGCNSHAGTPASATADKLRLGCKARRVLEILCGKIRLMSALPAWKPTERAVFRFFRDSEPAGPGALIIALARKHLPPELCARMARFFFTDYPNMRDEAFLSGEEIMAILHTGPGLMVGKAMKLLRDAESAGLVNDKTEALAYLGKNLLTKDEAVI
jgi:hypothetical protein